MIFDHETKQKVCIVNKGLSKIECFIHLSKKINYFLFKICDRVF